jgi:hypothetical protein
MDIVCASTTDKQAYLMMNSVRMRKSISRV